jgi:hypothetical protein
VRILGRFPHLSDSQNQFATYHSWGRIFLHTAAVTRDLFAFTALTRKAHSV